MLKIKFDPNSSTLNFISNLCAFFLTYSISFFLSPFIVETLGSEAYGFVSLATNFTNYISLVTVALNSLAGRFVSVSLFNKEYDKANQYYSSVIAANGIITGVLVVPCAVFILFLERFLDVPTALLTDVKILFALSSAVSLSPCSPPYSTWRCLWRTNCTSPPVTMQRVPFCG